MHEHERELGAASPRGSGPARVWGRGRTPASGRSSPAFDDQQRLAGEDQEVLLVGLPVAHPDRIAGPEHEEVDADLGKLRVVAERSDTPSTFGREPPDLAGVDDEPSRPGLDDPGARLFERRLRDHRRIIGRACRAPGFPSRRLGRDPDEVGASEASRSKMAYARYGRNASREAVTPSSRTKPTGSTTICSFSGPCQLAGV